MSLKKALICGVAGQDGSYLARHLLAKGYQVFGTSRDAQASSFKNLRILKILDMISYESMALNDFRSVLQVLSKIQPNEIYNLAGQSSVGLSFAQPIETMESIAAGTLNLLEGVRFLGLSSRIYNASSSECFGDTGSKPADEETPFRPKSPYAVAKAAAHWEVSGYRDSYGLYACNGILFNHESPLRPDRFVTKKIVASACRISIGSSERLHLGNIDVIRDWGWAPEYVDAMWRMLQQDKPEDFVIASGESHSLRNFIEKVFAQLKLDWRDHVVIDNNLFRPSDLNEGRANPLKAEKILDWSTTKNLDEIIKLLVIDQLERHSIDQEL
jgi:GDPmannose 4,6-dehydratase